MVFVSKKGQLLCLSISFDQVSLLDVFKKGHSVGQLKCDSFFQVNFAAV